MSEALHDKPVQRQRRRRDFGRITALVLVVAGFVLAWVAFGIYVYILHKADTTLRDAIAEADRLDPGWRLEDIFARRAADVIPKEENAAVRVLEVLERLPKKWKSSGSKNHDEELGLYRGENLQKALDEVAPNELLDEDLAAGLKEEMEELTPAVAAAKPLADLNRGRFELEYRDPVIRTSLSHTADSRQVARLLKLAATQDAQCGNLDAALDDCRAIIGVSRAVGDEPFLISMLVRTAEDTVAMSTLERVLAQGEASDAGLARMQDRLAGETRVPLGLIGLRGERAGYFDMLGKLANGTIPIAALSDNPPKPPFGRTRLPPHGVALYRYN